MVEVAVHKPILIRVSCGMPGIFDGNFLWVLLAVVTNGVVYWERLGLAWFVISLAEITP